MGRLGYPWYGEDFATLTETAKKLIAKIEVGKATDEDLKEFLEVSAEIVEHASKNKD